MTYKIDESSLKEGLLGLVIALVEIIEETLERQAYKRMESGRLKEEEVNRLGEALMEVDQALDKIKKENGIEDTVESVRESLDNIADDIVDKMISPKRWDESVLNG